MKQLLKIVRENKGIMLIILLVATAITVTGIVFHQSFLKLLPLYISLFIGFLSARINRYAPLIGGFNSILYTIVNISYGLYGNAFYTAFFSTTLQFITFARWKKRARGESTVLKRLTTKQRIIGIFLFAAVYTGLYFFLKYVMKGSYSLLDASTSLLGIIIAVLMMLSFVEYTWLNMPAQIISFTMYSFMVKDNHPEMIPYLIYSLYTLTCCVIAFFTARRLLREQQQEDVKRQYA